MWKLIFLVCLTPVSTVPLKQGTANSRPAIPSKIDLRPTTLVETKNAGGGYSKWQQIVAPAYAPISPCTCPGTSGWTQEELERHRLRTNLTGGPDDCFCSNSNYYWLESTSSPSGEDCRCPSVEGWSLEDLQYHNSISNLNGNSSDCFCSYAGVHSIQDLSPRDPVEVNCTCPVSLGWTADQLNQIKEITNLTANFNECFCESENGYSIRQKVYHPIYYGTDDHHDDDIEDKDGSSASSEEYITDEDIIDRPTKNNSSVGNADMNQDISSTEENALNMSTSTGGPPSDMTDCSSVSTKSPSVPNNNQRMVLTIDGNIKEFRLGPLWVKFAD